MSNYCKTTVVDCHIQTPHGHLPCGTAVSTEYARIASLEAELSTLRVERDGLIAQRHMTIARLGGVVEFGPTCELNFLQRVDELREIERKSKALRAENERLKGELTAAEKWMEEHGNF